MKTKVLLHMLVSVLVVNVFLSTNIYCQTQVIITSFEHQDKSVKARNISLLENTIVKGQIMYTLDVQTKSLQTSNYTIDKYYNLYDGKMIIKEDLKASSKKWKNQTNDSSYQNLLDAISENINSIERGNSWNASHHYLNIFIDLIQDGDTTTLAKSKPFEFNTAWLVNRGPKTVLNPEIDNIVFNLLPKKFPQRGLLNLERKRK